MRIVCFFLSCVNAVIFMFHCATFYLFSWVEESWLQLKRRKDMIKKGWNHCMLGLLHDPEFQEEASRMVIERSLFRGHEDCLPSMAAECTEAEATFEDIADPHEDMGLEGKFVHFFYLPL